jgi:hypothetical protein
MKYSGQPTPTFIELKEFIDKLGVDRLDTTEVIKFVLELLKAPALASSAERASAAMPAEHTSAPVSTAARSAFSLLSPTPSKNEKMVFILGENHAEPHFTDAKLFALTTQDPSPYKDYVLFTETSRPTTKKVFLSGKEVEKMMGDFVAIYHNSHLGEGELETNLEKLILGL